MSWNGIRPLDVQIEFQKELCKEFILPQRCSCCGESRQRKTDFLSPLILHFKDGDIQNKKPENLRFFCYNCYFYRITKKHKVKIKILERPLRNNKRYQKLQSLVTNFKELGDKLGDLFGKN